MPHGSRSPSDAELEQLHAQFRRDPGAVFVELGHAFLGRGRASDAVEIAEQGLRANPASLPGRVMASRAHIALQQWSEAQGELVRVVKADNRHREAFRLLGEVLLRQTDFARALPVLQHAHNLAPSDLHVADMIEHARQRIPLEPLRGGPPPVSAGAAASSPPRIPRPAGGPPPGALSAQDPFEPPTSFLPPTAGAAPEVAVRQAAPAVRPRIIGGDKPKDAASAALRRSAAVGEDYLNNLLQCGLLDVPNVTVPAQSYEPPPSELWGRSTSKLLIIAGVVALLGAGAASGWYVYQNHERGARIASQLKEAKAAMAPGTYAALKAGTAEALSAHNLDKNDAYAMAVYAEVSAISSLLYGEPSAQQVKDTIAGAAALVQSGQRGERELVIADAASTLAALDMLPAAAQLLADQRAALTEVRSRDASDLVAAWLLGVAAARAGDRLAAREAFTAADAGGQGVVAARVALADMLLDDGDHIAALTLYDSVLEREPEHHWALLGRSLARSERSTEDVEAMSDLNVGLADAAGPHLLSWKELATATAQLVIEDYEHLTDSLEKATGVLEPRFLARAGLLWLAEGRVAEAVRIRERIRWYGDAPLRHPKVLLLDARLLLARGMPRAALELVADMPGLHAHTLRGVAQFELGDAAAALVELDAALELAPDDLEVRTWREAARLVARRGERKEAGRALDKLGRQAKSKGVRTVHGLALVQIGEFAEARHKLELSLDELSTEYPNALAYRGHIALARLDLSAGKRSRAEQHVEAALEQNAGYLPAKGVLGSGAMARGDAARALENLGDLVASGEASAADELVFAEALMNSKPGTAEADLARAAVRRAHDKGANPKQLGRVALLVDPSLAEALGVAQPVATPPKRRRSSSKRGKRRRRR